MKMLIKIQKNQKNQRNLMIPKNQRNQQNLKKIYLTWIRSILIKEKQV